MKKVFSRILGIGIALAVVFGLSTCSDNTGLGAAVDTELPQVTVAYPPANSIIKGTFRMNGTCSDDKKISSVKIFVENMDTKSKDYAPIIANVAKNEKSWEVDVNNFDEETYPKTNGWELPDGNYRFNVRAYDNAGHVSQDYYFNVAIDNTPPIFVISSPGTAQISEATEFGGIFSIAGSVKETNEISKGIVNVYSEDDNDCTTPLNSEPFEFTYPDVTNGLKETIGQNIDSPTAEEAMLKDYKLYKEIYDWAKDRGKTSSDGTAKFYCKVELIDSAREYKGGEAGPGNSTQGKFYFSDAIRRTITNSPDFSAYDMGTLKYEKIVNGTDTIMSDADRTNFLSKLEAASSEICAFSVNPDADPTYECTSAYFNKNDTTPIYSEVASEASLTFVVKAGRDKNDVDPATLKTYMFGPYETETLMKAACAEIYSDPEAYYQRILSATPDPDGNYDIGGNKLRNVGSITMNSAPTKDPATRPDGFTTSAQQFTFQVPTYNSIKAKDFYVLAMTGNDVEGKPLRPAPGYYYVFTGSSLTVAPVVSAKLANNSYFGTTDLSFEAYASSANPAAKIAKVTWSGTVIDQVTGEKVVDISDVVLNVSDFTSGAGTNDVEYNINLNDASNYNAFKSENGGPSGRFYAVTINLQAEDDSGNKANMKEYNFYIDTKAPVYNKSDMLLLDSGTSYIGNTNVNFSTGKRYDLTGYFQDDGQGVKTYYYKALDGLDATINAPAKGNEGTEGWKMARVSGASVNEGIDTDYYCAKTIAIFGEDKLGNRSDIYKYSAQFDFNAPEVTLAAAKTTTKDDIVITATINEDELESAVLHVSGVNEVTKTFTASEISSAQSVGKYTLTYTLPASTCNDGTTKYKLEVKDKANPKVTSDTISVVFDKTKPLISITNLANNASVYGDEGLYMSNVVKEGDDYYYMLQGKWSDVSGSGTDKFEYSWDGTTFSEIEVANGNTDEQSYNAKIPGLTEGIGKKLYVRATDKVGNKSEVVSVTGFSFDYKKPVIKITKNVPVYVKKDDTMTVTATIIDETSNIDTSKIKVTSTKVSGEGSASTISITPSTSGSGKSITATITFSPTGATTDGIWNFTISAEDVNGHVATSVSTNDVTIDYTAPSFASLTVENVEETSFTSHYFNSDALTVKATVSDETSGLKKVYAARTAATETNAPAEDKWKGSASEEITVVGFDDGDNKIWLKFEDNAGNITEAISKIVKVDKTYPEISALVLSDSDSKDKKTSTNDKIYLSGSINEKSDIKEFVVHVYNENGVEDTTKKKTFTSSELTALNGSSDKEFNIPFEAKANGWSGYFKFSVDVTDIADNKRIGSITSDSILLDTTAPKIEEKITVDNVAKDTFKVKKNSELYADEGGFQNLFTVTRDDNTGEITSATFKLEGGWSDVGGSGTDKLYYRWGTTGDFTPFDGAMSTATDTEIFKIDVPVSQGPSQTLQLKAKDVSGNEMAEPYEITGLKIDFAKPVIGAFDYVSGSHVDNSVRYVNKEDGTLTIKATVTDTYGVTASNVNVYSGDVAANGNATFSNTAYTSVNKNPIDSKTVEVTITLNPRANGSDDKTWKFKLVAKDDCGREVSSITDAIVVDVTAPTLAGFKLDDEDYSSTMDLGNSSLAAQGTITEAGSGVSEVKYSIKLPESPNPTEKTLPLTGNTLEGITFAGLAEGDNEFFIKIFDKAGNFYTSGTSTITIDMVAPGVGLLDPTSDAEGTTQVTSASGDVYFTTEIEEGNLRKVYINVYEGDTATPSTTKSVVITDFSTSTATSTITKTVKDNITTTKIVQKFNVSSWADAKYKVKVYAIDKTYTGAETKEPTGNGSGKSAEKSFLVDTKPPVLTITSLTVGNGASGENVIYADEGTKKNYISIDSTDPTKATFNLKGTLKDLDASGSAASGTKQLFWSWDTGANKTWTAFPDAPEGVTNEKTFSVDLDVTQTAANETRTLYLKSTDIAGNETAIVTIGGIKIDYEKPVVYIAKDENVEATNNLGYDLITDTENVKLKDNTVYVKADGTLVLNAKVIDNYGGLTTDKVTVVVKKNGTSITPNTTTQKVTKTDTVGDGKVIDVKVEIAAGSIGGGSNDGKWTIEINATDANGRVAGLKTTTTAIIDATVPSMNDTFWGGNEIAQTLLGETYFNSTSLSILGYAADSISDIDYIEYTVLPGRAGATPSTGTFNAGDKMASGTYINNNKFSASISGFETGNNNVTLTPVDKAGNKGTPYSPTIQIDMSSPAFVSFTNTDGSELGGQKLTNVLADIKIQGVVTDDMALSEVYYTIGTGGTKYNAVYEEAYEAIDGTGTNVVGDSTKSYKNVKYSVTIPAADMKGNDGKQIMATVKDKAGNSTSQTVCTLIVDNTSPEYEISTSIVGLNGKTTIRGTGSDNKTPASFELYYAKSADYKGVTSSGSALTTFTETISSGERSDHPGNHGWTKVKFDSDNPSSDDKYLNTADIYNWIYSNFDWTNNSDAASKVDGSGKHTGIDTIYLLPVIIDKAGNSNAYGVKYDEDTKQTTYTWDLTEKTGKVVACTVDLNADKPIVKFENLDSGKILTFGTEATVRGSVTDDDSSSSSVVETFIMASEEITASGTAPNVTYKAGGINIVIATDQTDDMLGTGCITYSRTIATGTEVTTYNPKTGKWKFKPANINDGSKDVFIYVLDNNGTKFATGGTAQTNSKNELFMPKVQFNNQTETAASEAEEKITYNSDSNAPQITYIEVASSDTSTFTPSTADWKTFSAADSVGGKLKRYVKFRITSYDANGIAGMAFTLTDKNKAEVKKLDSKTSGDFTTAEIQEKGEATYPNSTWITKAIDLGGMDGVPSGLAELNAEPLDNSGMKGGLKMSIYVDNEVDMGSFKLSSPKADGDAQISEVTLSGIANENNGSGIAKVSWIVPKKGMSAASVAAAVKAGTDTEANGYKWQSNLAIGSSYSAWQFICDGTTKNNERFDTYANDTTNYGLTHNNFIFTMPVYFKVEDNLGNVAVSTDSTFLYNPNGNIPTARIVYPLTGEKDPVTAKINHTRVGTNLRITGSATDNDKVKEVFVQLALTANENDTVNWNESDSILQQEQSAGGSSYLSVTGLGEAGIVNYKGSTHDATMMTVDTDWWGIKAAGTTSWYLVVNSYGKFNKKYLHFRVCATDYDGYACVWSEEQVVYVDDDVPVIGANAYLAQFSDSNFETETARIPFSQDMYISGKTGDWYLVVSATDESGIKSTGVTEKIGGNSASNATYTAKDWTTSGVPKKSGATAKDKLIYIKLSTDVSTTVMYTISAVEDTENLKQGSYTCTVKIDNEAPKMEELLADGTQDISKNKVNGNKLQNSNGRVRLNSSLEEADSGFAFLAYQFVKKNDSKVYNPIPLYTGGNYVRQDATGTAIGGLTLDSGLYGKAYTNVAINNGNELTINDANIRKGGIVKVSGKYYLVTDVSGQKVTVDAVDLKGGANVFVPYALAVNYNSEGGINTESATGSFSSGYTVNEDDGDGIVEAVNKNGGIYKWEASIMSDCLADGEYEMRLTAFDNAGNYSTIVDWTGSSAKFNTFIANHEPRLAKIYLATDLNSNGKYSDDEFAYKNNVNGGDIDTYFYSALDGMNNEQEVVNLVTEGLDVDKAAKFSVRNGLAIGFEFVAGKEGQTGLDYIAKLGTEGATEPATGAIKAQVGSSTATQFTGPKDGGTRQVPAVMKSIIMDNATIKGLPGYAATMENKTDPATGKTALVTKTYAQISLWDRASGTQGGTADVKNADGYYTTYGNQFTVINIPVYLDTDDDQDPVSSIDKLTVENVQVNGDEAPLGHVEVGADLPAALFKMTGTDYTTYRNGLMDRNDKVSGEIFFTGKVSDNNYVKSLVLNIGDATTQNGNNDAKKLNANKVTVAEFNTTDGTLDFKANYGKANYGMNGWYIEKGEETFTQDSGHVVEWTLYIDTSKVTNGGGTRIFAATDVTLGMTASDGNATARTNYTPYTVDIVPYITSVERGEYNSAATGVYNEVKYQRSKFGEYAVVENETVTVRGFNFSSAANGTTVKVGDNNAVTKAATIAGTNTTKNTKSARDDYATNCSFTMTVPAKSGEMVVTVGGVESLNDRNNNEAENNIEINDYYKAGTMKDNRYLNVWNLGNYFKNTDNGAELQEPKMVAGQDGNLFASWVAQSNGNVVFSYGVSANKPRNIFRFYDQPGTTNSLAYDKSGSDAGALVGFVPEHQGLGGTYSNNAISDATIIGGLGAIQIPKADITAKTPATSEATVYVNGNPKMYDDNKGQNQSSWWNLANYTMNRRMASFEGLHSARFNDKLHTIWYDNVTLGLKYSVVNTNDANKYEFNPGAIAGWVLIDGGYTGQDRVHAWDTTANANHSANTIGVTGANQHTATGQTQHSSRYTDNIVYDNVNGAVGATSITAPNTNYQSKFAVGDTIALVQGTTGGGPYNITLKTITGVNGNTISWQGGAPHAFNNVTIYGGNMNVVGGSNTPDMTRFTPANDQSADAGSSAAIDIDTYGHPVIAYIDSDGSTLKVAYLNDTSKNEAADFMLATNWRRDTVPNVSCSGEISMRIDSNNNIHIMYQNTDGALCYIRGTVGQYSVSFAGSEEEIIDTQGSLSYGSLSVVENDTERTPVATYINTAATAQAIKYAKRTASGEWDVQIVPSTGSGHYALKNNQLSLEARKAGWTGTGDVLRNGGSVATATPATVNAAIAFKSSTAFETAYLKKE